VDGVLSRARVPELFADVEVLVQPSQNENFGFSVAEALAAGRAVVLGPTNGTADFAGAAGLLFDAYTPVAVAEALGRAFAAVRERGPELSAAARKSAREHFALGRVTDRFLAVCSEALALHRRPV
jgi:glycosyltransferase involved in cell wall biosynthesis